MTQVDAWPDPCILIRYGSGHVDRVVMDISMRKFQDRSPRMSADVVESNFVKYATPKEGRENRAAQFADVSISGMRVISRKPAHTNVGDLVDVEFTIPGSQRVIRNHARVVRKHNEFVFAIRFLGLEDEEKKALHETIVRHATEQKWSTFVKPLRRLMKWARSHRQGLWISVLAIAFLGTAMGAVYYNSDEYKGKAIGAWGQAYPQQWDWDYINKFNTPEKKSEK
jgi:hypothetical protein